MKQNRKVIMIAISLILASACLLAGCMYVLSNAPVEEKSYQADFVLGQGITMDTPIAQAAMQQKFSVYTHEMQLEDYDGGYFYAADKMECTWLFSNEQFLEIEEKKKNGERFYLTYDEILYIINDSIQMYNQGKTIILNRGYDIYGQEQPAETSFRDLTFANTLITPVSMDNIEKLPYKKGQQQYQRMCKDIYQMITYRLSMLDSGFTEAYLMSEASSIWQYAFSYDSSVVDSVFFKETIHLLYVDGGVFATAETYREQMKNAYLTQKKKIIGMLSSNSVHHEDLEALTLEYPLFVFRPNKTSSVIEVVGTDACTITMLFPTPEIQAAEPVWNPYGNINTNQITISIYDTDRTTGVTQPLLMEEIYLADLDVERLVECCAVGPLQDGAEKVEFSQHPYLYKVDFHNGTVIYLAPDSQGEAMVVQEDYKFNLSEDVGGDFVSTDFLQAIYEICSPAVTNCMRIKNELMENGKWELVLKKQDYDL